MRKLTALAATAFAGLLLASACGGGEEPAGTPAPPAATPTASSQPPVVPSPVGDQQTPTLTPTTTRTATAEPAVTPAAEAQRIAYVGTDLDIWVVNANGSGRHKLLDIDARAGDSVHNLQWSPDGSKLAITKSPGDVVYIVSARGEAILQVPGVAFLAWSPGGDIFAVARPPAADVEPAIRLLDLNGNTVAAFPNAFSPKQTPESLNLSFSSDGRRFAFLKVVAPPGGLCGVLQGFVGDVQTAVASPSAPPAASM